MLDNKNPNEFNDIYSGNAENTPESNTDIPQKNAEASYEWNSDKSDNKSDSTEYHYSYVTAIIKTLRIILTDITSLLNILHRIQVRDTAIITKIQIQTLMIITNQTVTLHRTNSHRMYIILNRTVLLPIIRQTQNRLRLKSLKNRENQYQEAVLQ